MHLLVLFTRVFFFFRFETLSAQNQFCVKKSNTNEKTIQTSDDGKKKKTTKKSFPPPFLMFFPGGRGGEQQQHTTTTTTTRDDEEETNDDDDDDEKTTGNDENDDENNDPSSRMEITHEPLFRTPPTYTRKTIFFYSSSFKQQRTNWGVTETTEKKVGRCKSENEH